MKTRTMTATFAARATAAPEPDCLLCQRPKRLDVGGDEPPTPLCHVCAQKALEVLAPAYLAAREVAEAFRREIGQHGVTHDEPECPEDDTCRCPNVLRVNAVFKAYDAIEVA